MKMSANLKFAVVAATSLLAFSLCGATNADAVVQYEQQVTPEVIFGSGNDNGSFTTDRRNGVEIGLRGKLRFNGDGDPENTFNSNSNGTYNFSAIVGSTQTAPTPEWSFEWTVNTNFDESSGLTLKDLTYEMGLDADPGPGTNFLIFDPITPDTPPLNAPFFDHGIGDNSTGNGGGTEATDSPAYKILLANNNVAQNSWRYDFFPFGPLAGFDPEANGTYAIYLRARNSEGQVVARADIQIIVGDAEPVVPADHFQCYDVRKSTRLDSHPEVSLNDQFGFRDGVQVGRKVEAFCTPVDKNGEGVINTDNILTCYSTRENWLRQEVVVQNQFGEHTLILKNSELLCVPSIQLSTRPLERDHRQRERRHEDD